MRFLVRAVVGLSMLLVVFAAASCGTSEADGSVERVDPRRAVALIAEADHVVLDVRDAPQFEAAHVRGAVHLDAGSPEFIDRVAGLDDDTAYLVYAQTRQHSAEVTDLMAGLGVERVVDAGGFGVLAIAGAPVVSGD